MWGGTCVWRDTFVWETHVCGRHLCEKTHVFAETHVRVEQIFVGRHVCAVMHML